MGLVRASPWPSYIERAAQIRREQGMLRLGSRAVHKLLSPVVEWGGITWFERTLDAAAESDRAPAGVTVREITPQDIQTCAAGFDPSQRPDNLAQRFARGDRAFAAIDAGGECAHTRWLTTSRAYIPEIGCDIVLAPGHAYFYNGYTRPDRRGLGIDGAVRNAIFAALRSEGYRAALSYVRRDNPAGLRAASRWQRSIGSVRYVSIAGGRPVVWGAGRPAVPELIRSERTNHDSARAAAWRRWFQHFAAEPMAKRSTGCDALPDAYFQSAAAFIASALRLGSSDDVLDVGCDSAMISRLIAPRCRRFAGIDIIPDMLRDARERAMGARHARARFIAADGRALPLHSGTFQKVYCSAMLHTLPSRADGLAVIDELIRVTADGGDVLLSSVPDRAKRLANRVLIWQRAPWIGKLTLPIRWAVPASARRLARRLLRMPHSGPPAFLDYDLRAIARSLAARGMTCTVADFPPDYWSTDFRRTRSNLLITVRRGSPPDRTVSASMP